MTVSDLFDQMKAERDQGSACWIHVPDNLASEMRRRAERGEIDMYVPCRMSSRNSARLPTEAKGRIFTVTAWKRGDYDR